MAIRVRRAAAVVAASVVVSPAIVVAQTWTGGSASSNGWTDAANWSGGVPGSGSATVINFASGSPRLSPVQNVAIPFELNRLNFTAGATASYSLSGNGFRMQGPIVPNNLSSSQVNMDSPVDQTIATDIDLPLSNTFYTVGGNGAGTLFMNGLTTGAGILRKTGSSTLQIGKALTASSGASGSRNISLEAGTLRLGNNDLISSDIQLSQSGGTFDLNGKNQTLDVIFRTGGTINLGTGTLSLGAGSNGGTVGGLVGPGTVVKNAGSTQFTAPSPSFTGQVSIRNGGTLFLDVDGGLGTTAGNTVVEPGGTLVLTFGGNYATAEPVTLQGIGGLSGGAALFNAFASANFAGPVTLAGNSGIGSGGTGLTFTLTGGVNLQGFNATFGSQGGATVLNTVGISGNGGIVKQRFDERLVLNAPSTYTGATTVNAGILDANATLATSSITVASSATLRGTTVANNAALSLTGNLLPGLTGDGVGQITVASASLVSGARLSFDIQDATGAAGVGYDQLAVLGALSAPGASGISILVRSLTAGGVAGQAVNFVPSQAYAWPLIDAASLNADVSLADFTLNTDLFTVPPGVGAFALALTSGSDLILTYAPIPEPTTLAALAVMGLTFRRRAERP